MPSASSHGASVSVPPAALAGALATITLTLPPATPLGKPWPNFATALISDAATGVQLGNATVGLYSSGNATLDGLALLTQSLQFDAPSSMGYTRLGVSLLPMA